jgi:hypothetical protein
MPLVRRRPLCLIYVLCLCGGCCTGASLERTRQLVHAEVPIGSSESDVKRFCEQHQFEYEQANPGEGWARLERRGCLEDIVARILYDEAGRVKSTEVNIENVLP